MRQDRIVIDGPNPFLEFSKSKELTILLDTDAIVFVASDKATHLMRTYPSVVRTTEEEDGDAKPTFKNAYTIPLTLMLPLLKLDTKEKENILVIESREDSCKITYNGIPVTTDIFSPNGLTIHQIKDINIEGSLEVSPKPFIHLNEVFGVTKDNFINVQDNVIFISDGSKCVLTKDMETQYTKDFSIPISFVRLMKSMDAEKLFIGNNVVAETKSGLWLVTALTKVSDPNVLMDYRFAAKVKSTDIYTLNINKYLKHIGLAVQVADISAELDLTLKQLTLTSVNNEKAILHLDSTAIALDGENPFSFGLGGSGGAKKNVVLNDARLIRSLATFSNVKLKICDTLLLAKLGTDYRMLFTLRR